MNRRSASLAVLLSVGVTLLGLTGCATATQPTAMTAPALNLEHHSTGSVQVTVSGGSETTATGPSSISNADFASAIRQSISATRLFAQVAATAPADYRLDVMIARVQQPLFGLTYTVNRAASISSLI